MPLAPGSSSVANGVESTHRFSHTSVSVRDRPPYVGVLGTGVDFRVGSFPALGHLKVAICSVSHLLTHQITQNLFGFRDESPRQ